MGLIDECTREDGFYDKIAETDIWCNYMKQVIEPREAFCND